MLWNASGLLGCAIQAVDGDIGSVTDLLYDDSTWTMRWLVVDTGNWLPGRKVLLPVNVLGQPEAGLKRFPVQMTMQQVKDSPDIDTNKSVSRAHEAHIFDFYGLDPYWGGNLVPLSNAMAVPLLAPLAPDEQTVAPQIAAETVDSGDPHLRSATATTGYQIHATDGQIGHAADFLVDTQGWSIRYIKVDTGNWWPGQLVLIAPHLVQQIDWAERVCNVSIDREKVKGSPPYHADMTVDGAFDEKTMAYYNYTGSIGDM